MRNVLVISSLLTLFFLSTVMAETLDEIEWMTEEYPPYNFIENNTLKGISVDLLLAIWEKAGVNKTAADIQVVPWARGVKTLKSKPGTCLFATSLTFERTAIFGWKYVYPIPQANTDSNDHIIVKKGSNIKFQTVDDLKMYNKKFGVIRGDIGATLLIENGVSPDKLDKTASSELLIKKLYMGRYEAISYGYSTTISRLKEAGQNPSEYEIAFSFPIMPLGYAFHKTTDPAIITELQKILDELHKDGTTAKIRQKYLPK